MTELFDFHFTYVCDSVTCLNFAYVKLRCEHMLCQDCFIREEKYFGKKLDRVDPKGHIRMACPLCREMSNWEYLRD